MADLITTHKMASFRVFPTPDPLKQKFIRYTRTKDY